MLIGLYSAATGLSAAEKNHEVIAHNLAHINVPGFRRSVASFATFEQAMQQALEDPAAQGHGTWAEQLQVDFSPGPLVQTGRQLDLALNGDGFFTVQTPEGPLYTRNGVFQIDQDGRLVTSDGYPLLGENRPIELPPNVAMSDITITRDGMLHAAGVPLGQIDRVQFIDNRLLIPAGTTLFAAPNGVVAEPSEVEVYQGMREQSNVSPVTEMVRMIAGMRHYEATQRALRSMEDAVSQTTDPQAG